MEATNIQIQSLLFDLDGTLVNSLPVTLDGFNTTLVHFGCRPHTVAEIMAHFGPGEDEIFKEMLGQEAAQDAFEYYKRYIADHLDKIELHAGILPLLKFLDSQKVPLGLVTGRTRAPTQAILEHVKIGSFFSVRIVSNDVTHHKPDPEGILLALKKLKVSSQTAMYVGDTATDVLAARGAGAYSTACVWDALAQLKKIKAEHPTFIAKDPKAIEEIWKSHGKSADR